jgi:flagellar motor switch protein FliN/FliY
MSEILFYSPGDGSGGDNIGMIMDVQVEVTAQLGSCMMTMGEVLGLSAGTVVQLKQKATEPVVLCLNDKPVAKGEVVVVENSFGIKITEMIES